MNDFDQIRNLTMDVILKHRKTTNTLKNWKEEIRATLLTIKENFIFLIDDYTDKFCQSLRDIDQS